MATRGFNFHLALVSQADQAQTARMITAGDPSAPSVQLLRLARYLAAPYQSLPELRACLLTGSVAEGLSDTMSDIDIAFYYTELPTETDLERIRVHNGATQRKWVLGNPNDGAFIEAYDLAGVECQLIHSSIAHWEARLADIFEAKTLGSPLNKAASGMQKGLALYGEDLIDTWKARLDDYPEALAHTTVAHYLQFFPLWAFDQNLAARDAQLFFAQSLLEAVQNLLGVLSGLNRVYYSSFQFKRLGAFAAQLRLAPPDLARRINALFRSDATSASRSLRELVAETVTLVENQLPGLDTSRARRALERRLEPWSPQAVLTLCSSRAEESDPAS